MDIENQVCSLELSKKLEELGCPQKGLWYYYWHKTDHPPIPQLQTDFGNGENNFLIERIL